MRDFVTAAAEELGMRIRWEGQGVAEKGYDERGRCIVAVDPALLPSDRGRDPAGRSDQGARPARLATPRSDFRQLVAEMVREDLKAAERDELVKKHGYSAYDLSRVAPVAFLTS